MKILLAGLAATILLAGAPAALAQDSTTVVHKTVDGDRSKTVVNHADGAKTVIKRHGSHVKKVHTSPDGDKTIVKKTTDH
jgi:hypothetical protein